MTMAEENIYLRSKEVNGKERVRQIVKREEMKGIRKRITKRARL